MGRRYFHLGIPLVLAALCATAAADTTTEQIRAAIKRHSAGKVDATSVTPSPIPGLFEVIADGDVFYTDATGRYSIIDGRLVDSVKRVDLTQATLDRISQIDFKTLPQGIALKTVRGNGRRQLAVFEDPACPVCRNLHQQLSELQDVTIYTYTLPIIEPSSIPAAVATWCAPAAKRAERWAAYMNGETPPDRIEPGCEAAKNTVKKILTFGEKYRIRNTPTLVVGNGRRIVGGAPLQDIVAALDAVGGEQ